jgi:hypothetical protein
MPKDEKDQPTEKTPTGYKVPVPKRNEFFGNLKKAARPGASKQPHVPPRPNPRGRPTKGK